jgi:radical SAM superfamily enzyme YgiQ (UPF0313 family)
MNVLLISPPVMDKNEVDELIPLAMDAKKIAPPYGIYLLATILRKHDHKVDIADLIASGSKDIDVYLKKIDSYDLVGIGATSFSWPTALECINEIRGVSPGVPIVLGGIHPTMFDYFILHKTPATFVVRGEAEYALVELCEVLEGKRKLSDVTSLTYRNAAGEVIRNQIERIVDLATIPPPDYSAIPRQKYIGLSLESSRGCPFDCIFCSTSYRKSYRTMEPVKFVDHVEFLSPHLDATLNKTIHIADDEFSANLKRSTAIFEEVARRNINTKFVFNARAPDVKNEKFVKTIAPYVSRFLVGAECGYNEGLKKTGKQITTEILEEAAQMLARYDLARLSDFSFVIGFPWESYDDAVKTINFASVLQIKYGINVLMQWYLQVPGSRLWQKQRELGVVNEAMYDEFGIFRNLYLFRTGVNFSLQEFRSLSNLILSVRMVNRLGGIEAVSQFQYAHPLPIRRYFPLASDERVGQSGLASLRDLSRLGGRKAEKTARCG